MWSKTSYSNTSSNWFEWDHLILWLYSQFKNLSSAYWFHQCFLSWMIMMYFPIHSGILSLSFVLSFGYLCFSFLFTSYLASTFRIFFISHFVARGHFDKFYIFYLYILWTPRSSSPAMFSSFFAFLKMLGSRCLVSFLQFGLYTFTSWVVYVLSTISSRIDLYPQLLALWSEVVGFSLL